MTKAQEYDPFEAFNRNQGGGANRDLYARLAELHRQGPVVLADLAEFIDPSSVPGGAKVPEGLLEVYVALSHDAVSEVLRDGKRFSSSLYSAVMGPVMGRTILEMDEPEHSRVRGLLQQAFTKRSLERWERDVVAPVVNRLVDQFAGSGHADLVRQFTFPFPVSVIALMLGLPEKHHHDFHRWAVELISFSFNAETALAASKSLADLFRPLLHERRERPGDDLLSLLAVAELDGERLSDDDIFAFLRLLAPAGAETTYRSSSNLLFGLLTHPDQLDALRSDPRRMDNAIDEGLRWEAPLTGILRTATEDTEVCGVKIPAGAMVQVQMGAANHDPTRYPDPERFDIFRTPKQHMAFAFGPHRCLGMHLARMETRVALQALFDRCPGLRLDPAWEDPHISGASFRSPRQLPVLFDA